MCYRTRSSHYTYCAIFDADGRVRVSLKSQAHYVSVYPCFQRTIIVDATLHDLPTLRLAAGFQVFLIKPRVARSAFIYARIGINPATTAGNAPGKDYLVPSRKRFALSFLTRHHRPVWYRSGGSSWQYEV